MDLTNAIEISRNAQSLEMICSSIHTKGKARVDKVRAEKKERFAN